MDFVPIVLLLTFQFFGAPVLLVAIAKGAYKVALPLGVLLILSFLVVHVPPMEPGLPGG